MFCAAVNASLDQLHSSASEYTKNGHTDQEDEAVVAKRLLKEQQEILKIDDIVEYDSNEEDNCANDNVELQAEPQSISNALPAGTNTNKTAESLTLQGTTSENHTCQQVPVRSNKPVKRITNPYRTKSSKALSQQSNNVQRGPAEGESRGPEIELAKCTQSKSEFVKTEPGTSVDTRLNQAVEAKAKATRRKLMDV